MGPTNPQVQAPLEGIVFRFAIPLAYLRRSPRATRLTRCAIGALFTILDARNTWRDKSLPT